MRRQALTTPESCGSSRLRGFTARWLVALVALAALLLPLPAGAAEVLQVRSGTLLQIGDRNRSYAVELACVAVAPADDAAAAAWLRQALPRRSRVNLRPRGSDDGTLLASVQRLAGGSGADQRLDLGQGLVAAGLATALPHCDG